MNWKGFGKSIMLAFFYLMGETEESHEKSWRV